VGGDFTEKRERRGEKKKNHQVSTRIAGWRVNKTEQTNCTRADRKEERFGGERRMTLLNISMSN